MDSDVPCKTLLHSLDEDCLLHLFELLNVEDLISIAETCTKFEGIASRLFKKCSEFVLDPLMIERGPAHIDRVLTRIGQHVTSLEIICTHKYRCCRLLKWIQCSKLKRLRIYGLNRACKNALLAHSFDNLELMTSARCDLGGLTNAVKNFKKLKWLNICQSNIELNDLKMILFNNPSIESFVFGREVRADYNFDCELLALIPKVQKLALFFVDGKGVIDNLDLLPTLDSLTTLRIDCRHVDIGRFLSRLSQKPLLKELELHVVSFDESLIVILTEFINLEVLHVDASINEDSDEPNVYLYDPFIVWPRNIKQLLLRKVDIDHDVCMSTIEQLRSLECFEAGLCLNTTNADVLFEEIYDLLGDRTQKLYLPLPWYFKFSFRGLKSVVNLFTSQDNICDF